MLVVILHLWLKSVISSSSCTAPPPWTIAFRSAHHRLSRMRPGAYHRFWASSRTAVQKQHGMPENFLRGSYRTGPSRIFRIDFRLPAKSIRKIANKRIGRTSFFKRRRRPSKIAQQSLIFSTNSIFEKTCFRKTVATMQSLFQIRNCEGVCKSVVCVGGVGVCVLGVWAMCGVCVCVCVCRWCVGAGGNPRKIQTL